MFPQDEREWIIQQHDAVNQFVCIGYGQSILKEAWKVWREWDRIKQVFN